MASSRQRRNLRPTLRRLTLVFALGAAWLAWGVPNTTWMSELRAEFVEDGSDKQSTSAPAPTAPTTSASQPRSTEECLKKGMDLERKRDWSAAIEVYTEGVKTWPKETSLTDRRRLCQMHYRLGKRYQDPSFKEKLLPISAMDSKELYHEVLEQIHLNYVEPVSLEGLVRNGFDNLEVALRDSWFLNEHAQGFSKERIRQLRDTLKEKRNSLRVQNMRDAQAWLDQACLICQETLGIPSTPVVLEFTFAACEALDEYTNCLTPNKLKDIRAMIDGNFVGLGVELKFESDSLLLVGVIKGGPAADAGLKVGDRITHIGSESLAGMNLDAAANKLQGPERTVVEIGVRHRDGQSRFYRLARRSIEVESVAQARMIDAERGVGYIQLIGFQRTSSEEVRQAIVKLQQQGMKALILDLRDNPGGLLHIAIEIADQFLDSGRIVSTKGRAHGQSMEYEDNTPAEWITPLAVLIDHSSASASEILAGALQENHRALIIGETSYGKGSVQSIFELKTQTTGLKLTTAKFYSPTDRPYSGRGVVPDMPIQTAAKPTGNAKSALPPEFGDLQTDSTLRLAIGQSDRFPELHRATVRSERRSTQPHTASAKAR